MAPPVLSRPLVKHQREAYERAARRCLAAVGVPAPLALLLIGQAVAGRR
jgi:hypothetical protein